MMNFDTPIDRRGTGSLKWDRRVDLDPYWVADMDFTSPPEVISAIRERVDHGVFGYAVPHPSLVETLQGYLQDRINYSATEEQIVHLGGLVPALSLAARAFGKPGDAVLTCTPIYPPFLGIHDDASMELQTVDHAKVDDHWTFDWEALEAKVTPQTKIFVLSNPQNPMGRVFTKEEIIQLATFCEKHELILLSDEIHCDLILDEKKTPHFSALNLPEPLRDSTITLLAPSKTYNIAGLGYAFAVIPNDSIRRRFTAARGHTLPEINCIAYHAAEAAYKHGEPWRQDLLAYLRTNCSLLTSTIREKIPGATIPEIEATYLAWIDCKDLPIENPIQVIEKAGLFLSDGAYFGHGRCVRMNFGTQTERLKSALDTLVNSLR
ncbi:MAG: MalY/PatB family protein [Verrucomicrobiales bacterium]|jgi:cystathionine beta-lyase|tara:strand:- start:8524 stop:9657 length:1134 start_codon:yes stop_codon:yes gene_type:complete